MKQVFSVAVVFILLFIYVYLVYLGLEVGYCLAEEPACKDYKVTDFNDKMAWALAMIGGLISALVVAELAVTKPNEPPAARLLASDMVAKAKRPMQIITGLYLLIWLVAGCSAFAGYLRIESTHLPPAIAELGKAWLGIAVGAAYAFFGIDRSTQ